MPSEVHASVNLGTSKGQHRTVFRNPRGQKDYYAFYIDPGNNGRLTYEWSSNGTTWTTTPIEVAAINTIASFDVKIHDTGSDLDVFFVFYVNPGSRAIRYAKGIIDDPNDTISISGSHVINSVVRIMAGTCVAIARTDNGRLVVAFTEDFNAMGKDYRRVNLMGSDGDGLDPTWSGEIIWYDPSTNNNNDLKGEVWFGLENFNSSYPNRVLLAGRSPASINSTAYTGRSAVPDWNGTAFSGFVSGTFGGTHADEAKVVSLIIDESDVGHVLYYDGNEAELVHRKSQNAGADDFSGATENTVKANDVDACTLALDTAPVTDELYAFYHDVADSTDFHYKVTPIDTISWGSEQTVTFSSDLIALTSWSRDVENGLHVGIEDADTDVWYHEHSLAAPPGPIPDRLYEVEQHINRVSTY